MQIPITNTSYGEEYNKFLKQLEKPNNNNEIVPVYFNRKQQMMIFEEELKNAINHFNTEQNKLVSALKDDTSNIYEVFEKGYQNVIIQAQQAIENAKELFFYYYDKGNLKNAEEQFRNLIKYDAFKYAAEQNLLNYQNERRKLIGYENSTQSKKRNKNNEEPVENKQIVLKEKKKRNIHEPKKQREISNKEFLKEKKHLIDQMDWSDKQIVEYQKEIGNAIQKRDLKMAEEYNKHMLELIEHNKSVKRSLLELEENPNVRKKMMRTMNEIVPYQQQIVVKTK